MGSVLGSLCLRGLHLDQRIDCLSSESPMDVVKLHMTVFQYLGLMVVMFVSRP